MNFIYILSSFFNNTDVRITILHGRRGEEGEGNVFLLYSNNLFLFIINLSDCLLPPLFLPSPVVSLLPGDALGSTISTHWVCNKSLPTAFLIFTLDRSQFLSIPLKFTTLSCIEEKMSEKMHFSSQSLKYFESRVSHFAAIPWADF